TIDVSIGGALFHSKGRAARLRMSNSKQVSITSDTSEKKKSHCRFHSRVLVGNLIRLALDRESGDAVM
ncbi:MAG TPA: hypothetical protein VNX23_20115, partial [Bradyrhizobium sp.]|uniref:hypothetical protein n=1 Tax=Bradyrhizobium sp. TaxID=376 RepID=UPI002C3BB1CD